MTTGASLRPVRRAPYQLWQCVLNVVLVEAVRLAADDDAQYTDAYVKFRLENERYRSKTVRGSVSPRYLEQFQLYVYDMQKAVLDVGVFDINPASNYDELIGKLGLSRGKGSFINYFKIISHKRVSIDLKTLEVEKTHFIKQPLDGCQGGTITLLLSVTGTYGNDSIPDFDLNKDTPDWIRRRDEIKKKYVLITSMGRRGFIWTRSLFQPKEPH